MRPTCDRLSPRSRLDCKKRSMSSGLSLRSDMCPRPGLRCFSISRRYAAAVFGEPTRGRITPPYHLVEERTPA